MLFFKCISLRRVSFAFPFLGQAARSAAKAATSLAKGQPLSQVWSHMSRGRWTKGLEQHNRRIADPKIPKAELEFQMCNFMAFV